MAFKKIKPKKKSTHIAEQIIDAITKGTYKIGDKLPSERKISEETGVSRPSVREALSALQLVGIVEIKGGDGNYIKEYNDKEDGSILDRTFTILEKSMSPYDVLEARRVFEPSIIELAAIKASAEDIKKMRSALIRLQKTAQAKNRKLFYLADQEFHLSIAGSTKNPIIERVARILLKPMSEQMWEQLKKSGNPENVDAILKSHERIFSAIENRNSDLAISEMIQHIENTKKYLFDNVKEDPNGIKT